MSLGKVTVWKMTEEERLAYIAKHPIIPTEKPSGFTNAKMVQVAPEKKSKHKGPRIIDTVDKDELHKLFIEGKTFDEMAKSLNVSVAVINNYIKEQRKLYPEKWPRRSERMKVRK